VLERIRLRAQLAQAGEHADALSPGCSRDSG
jgi:hypothetical protein